MITEEKFKIWLTTIYVSKQTGKSLITPNHYAGGIKHLNRILKLSGEGIYDERTDLKHIRNLISQPANFHKDYSSHFNAFVKFREYYAERNNQSIKPLQRQSDVFKKQRVEMAAVETVIKHFESLEYTVVSKEKDNIGWDLEATNSKEKLPLEVKGLSGNVTSIEVTPNEYRNCKEKNAHYKFCIVTNALVKPNLEIFSFDTSLSCWMNNKNEKLHMEERIAARFWKD